jgi:Replication initiator protein, pSAM2
MTEPLMAEPPTSTVTLDAEVQTGSGIVAEMLARASQPDYERWMRHVEGAAACEHPIRLTGQLHTIDQHTGEILETRPTASMPDGQLYTACGNRRATVCPACSEVYRADTYQLILAGLRGGKGIPEQVAGHPCVFATFTAPSFGYVHSRREKKRSHKDQPIKALPCRPRRRPEYCQHGVNLVCNRTHREAENCLGQALCARCYDYQHQVVWNLHAGELWRRTAQHVRRLLTRQAREHGAKVRVSYAKVAEFQARGVVHFHAIFRLDGLDPDNPDQLTPLPGCMDWRALEYAVRAAGLEIGFYTAAHPTKPDGWEICWGDQLDVRPVRVPTDDYINDDAVAAYLAKYATKATEVAGHVSSRLSPATIDTYATQRTHPGRLIAAAWDLGHPAADVLRQQAAWVIEQKSRLKAEGQLVTVESKDGPIKHWRCGYGRLQAWAHMLGYGGHFSTRSRAYSTTLRTLRKARQSWRRRAWHRTADHLTDDDVTTIATELSYAGIGWHTSGDAALANSAAARARERRQTARDEAPDLDDLID